jgi:hypothetical protein
MPSLSGHQTFLHSIPRQRKRRNECTLREKVITHHVSPITTTLQRLALFLLIALPAGNFAAETTIDTNQFVIARMLPPRVHVCEDFETDIERRWWLRGTVETNNLPPSLTPTLANSRACRATPKPGEANKAVVFNPVPGPPMGPNPLLSFRYWLKGDDQLRVQIFSLTKEINRQLVLTNLPQGKWQSATVDIRKARQPDGSGGPLSEDERIDDIQFYVATNADLIIDDIVLFEAPPETERRPFPRRIIFTAWFDTGKQGAEWPGDFEIVPHEKPLTWKAAKSVTNSATQSPWIRLNMRGFRRLSAQTQLRFRYHLKGSTSVTFALANSQSDQEISADLPFLDTGIWTFASVRFKFDPEMPFADEIRFRTKSGAELLIDDVLLFEPGQEGK